MDAVLDQKVPKRARRRGFSYLDVMVAVVIVGVAIVALMQSMTTSTTVNGSARELSVAVNLTRHVHERAMSLGMSQVDALDGQTFTTPIGSDGKPLAGYTGWEQKVLVYKAEPTNDLEANAASGSTSKIRRIVVEATYKGEVVHRESWLLAPVGL